MRKLRRKVRKRFSDVRLGCVKWKKTEDEGFSRDFFPFSVKLENPPQNVSFESWHEFSLQFQIFEFSRQNVTNCTW